MSINDAGIHPLADDNQIFQPGSSAKKDQKNSLEILQHKNQPDIKRKEKEKEKEKEIRKKIDLLFPDKKKSMSPKHISCPLLMKPQNEKNKPKYFDIQPIEEFYENKLKDKAKDAEAPENSSKEKIIETIVKYEKWLLDNEFNPEWFRKWRKIIFYVTNLILLVTMGSLSIGLSSSLIRFYLILAFGVILLTVNGLFLGRLIYQRKRFSFFIEYKNGGFHEIKPNNIDIFEILSPISIKYMIPPKNELMKSKGGQEKAQQIIKKNYKKLKKIKTNSIEIDSKNDKTIFQLQ